MKRVRAAGAVLLVAALGVYAAALHTENVVETHATYADAVAAGARDRGWLPTFVPATAFAIRGVHDLDSGTSGSASPSRRPVFHRWRKRFQ